MPTSPSSLFRHSLLAAAILSATGCASTSPNTAGNGGFGDTLANAGRATADVTARAWHRTGYLLGLHDDGGPTQVDHALDEVDLAMLEEDAVLPSTARTGETTVALAATGIERAIARPAAGTIVATAPSALYDNSGNAIAGADGELVALNVAPVDDGLAVGRFVAPAAEELEALEPLAVQATLDTVEQPAATAAAGTVALDDYTHVVGKTETLWDIAKKTTGDATNWHVLADVNNLAPNAAVYPGQGLVIPADMVKPELASATTLPAVANEPSAVATAAPAERLTVPAAAAAQPAIEAVAQLEQTPATPSPVAPAAMRPSDDARGFRIEGGETLWDFAKRTTGDATYWQAIAAHNGFDEKRAVAVREGEEIFVPDTLVRAELGGNAPVAVAAAESVPTAIETPAATRMVPIAEASDALPAEAAVPAAVLAGADAALDSSQDMKIVEAAYRGDDATAPAADTPSEVMISGTYYPKAVYNDADFSASLLMRVSPGTRLRVASVEGPWYAVETDDGIGYVHDRDIK